MTTLQRRSIKWGIFFISSLSFVVFLYIYFIYLKSQPHTQDDSKRESKTFVSTQNIHLSQTAQKLAQVEVAPVIRKFVPFRIRLFGKIEYDETTLAHITAWVPGRIEKLYVNYTGIEVQEGDPMVDYYSPEFIVAQEELIQSKKAYEELQNTPTSFAKDQSKRNLESSRVKLRLLGLENSQVEKIESSAQVEEIIQVKAPDSGVVIHLNALEGQYVNEGTKMFTIANLDEVWVEFEAYEKDLPGLELNANVEFTTDALPGKSFTGTISFIDPFLNEKTRTASIRVNVDNRDGLLKPGMFVDGMVTAWMTADGTLMSQRPDEQSPPLVIQATAPLITGKRAIVYVQNPQNPGEYQLREVVLGPKVGEYYIITSGLKEREKVVVHGNFKIDSAAQIKALPSMMSPEGGRKQIEGHQH